MKKSNDDYELRDEYDLSQMQVILDPYEGNLAFNLLDMSEGGRAGAEMTVTANGPLILPGFAGSAIDNLNITINDYAELWDMIRSDYGGRLVDVLKVKMA